MNLISIAVEQDPDRQARNTVQTGLFDANVDVTGDGHFDVIFVAARDSNANLVGGVVGEAYWGYVNFTAVWVHPEHRRRGLASQMLNAAEVEAARLGYSQAYLDTFSFQAPELYLGAGYEVFGTLDNFPAGAKRLFLRKAIAPQAT
ncbi:GNAT family N-acetyltransferase [Paucibacter sp. B2R-40]|uniref:GNAT family N-acetyltransferase n=1 Tax=Paucibacter sp. B2R-40 TaxID=2893554 RepID=UPI0021E3ED06|nr:GNAT family N-acetyltransferase [Paucibacter sp. B2R-40]MCV2356787.1 GNAT family N-acetyltransferase [Paucibacter sp. B2R-40]